MKKQIEDWQYIQSLALDVLEALSDEQLDLNVGKNMGTLGEQFRHMARVRFQYAEAIKTKKIAKTIEKIDPTVAKSKVKLIELWEKANQKLLQTLEKLDNKDGEDLMINWEHWGIDSMSLADHLNALADHETFHNGQVVVYLRTHEIPFPKSWEAWGL